MCDREGVLLMDGVMLMHSARTAKIQQTLASGEVGDNERPGCILQFQHVPALDGRAFIPLSC